MFVWHPYAQLVWWRASVCPKGHLLGEYKSFDTRALAVPLFCFFLVAFVTTSISLWGKVLKATQSYSLCQKFWLILNFNNLALCLPASLSQTLIRSVSDTSPLCGVGLESRALTVRGADSWPVKKVKNKNIHMHQFPPLSITKFYSFVFLSHPQKYFYFRFAWFTKLIYFGSKQRILPKGDGFAPLALIWLIQHNRLYCLFREICLGQELHRWRS